MALEREEARRLTVLQPMRRSLHCRYVMLLLHRRSGGAASPTVDMLRFVAAVGCAARPGIPTGIPRAAAGLVAGSRRSSRRPVSGCWSLLNPLLDLGVHHAGSTSCSGRDLGLPGSSCCPGCCWILSRPCPCRDLVDRGAGTLVKWVFFPRRLPLASAGARVHPLRAPVLRVDRRDAGRALERSTPIPVAHGAGPPTLLPLTAGLCILCSVVYVTPATEAPHRVVLLGRGSGRRRSSTSGACSPPPRPPWADAGSCSATRSPW